MQDLAKDKFCKLTLTFRISSADLPDGFFPPRFYRFGTFNNFLYVSAARLIGSSKLKLVDLMRPSSYKLSNAGNHADSRTKMFFKLGWIWKI